MKNAVKCDEKFFSPLLPQSLHLKKNDCIHRISYKNSTENLQKKVNYDLLIFLCGGNSAAILFLGL